MLSTPIRLHLMWLLCHAEHDVGTLADEVGATVATVSQHLAKLRLAGLVSARRQGRHQIYAADDTHVLVLVEQVFAHIAPDGSLAADAGGRARSAPRRPRFDTVAPR
jgi:DNA-binding transcriptional ArsR family regulator